MIEHLKKLYPKAISTDPSKPDTRQNFDWFQTEEGPVGILKNNLSKKERSLLEMFLTPYIVGQSLNDQQNFWHRLLFRGEITSEHGLSEGDAFRFVHFYVKDPSIDVESFNEAVNGVFPSGLTILWETEQEGVLIEQVESLSETTFEYQDLADAVTSDFFTDLYLYVGRVLSGFKGTHAQYRKEKTYFSSCREQFHAETVFFHDENIAFLLLEQTSDSVKKDLFVDLLGETSDDKELLNSIFQYLSCDMNVTTAAKKLFIHRNSLQYRVDKFIEKTGLNVRSFPQAVTTYLILLDYFHSSRKA